MPMTIPGGRALAEVDRAAPAGIRLLRLRSRPSPQPSPSASCDRRVALDVAHARRGAQAPQRGGERRCLGRRTSDEPELAIERRHARGRAAARPAAGRWRPGGSATTKGRSSAAAFTRRPPRAVPSRARARRVRGARSRPSPRARAPRPCAARRAARRAGRSRIRAPPRGASARSPSTRSSTTISRPSGSTAASAQTKAAERSVAPSRRASSAALRSASVGPAQRAECSPGSPPSAATSMPESSPSPICPSAGSPRGARLEQRVARVGVGVLLDLDRARLDVGAEQARQLGCLAGVPRGEHRAQPAHRGAATACSCAASIRCIPAAPSSSSRSSCARSNGWPSAVPWTSTRRPPLVMTTLRSTSAVESSL